MSNCKSSPIIEAALENYRKLVPRLVDDRVLSIDMEATVGFLFG